MNDAYHPRGRLSGALGWCAQVVAWLVILGATAVIMASVIVPRIGGATPYVILTGSMRPAMPPGTLVVAKPVKPQDIGVGTVVTYQLFSGEPTVVTHRVKRVSITADGKYRFQTQGDANNIPDAKLVTPAQIRGERWYFVPYLGYVTSLLTGDQRHFFTSILVIGLLVYAVWMFTGTARDRLRPQGARKGRAGHEPSGAQPRRPAGQHRRGADRGNRAWLRA